MLVVVAMAYPQAKRQVSPPVASRSAKVMSLGDRLTFVVVGSVIVLGTLSGDLLRRRQVIYRC